MKKVLALLLAFSLILGLKTSFVKADSMEFEDEFAIVVLDYNIEVRKQPDPKSEKIADEYLAKDAVKKVIDRTVEDSAQQDLKSNYRQISDRLLANYRSYIKETTVLTKGYDRIGRGRFNLRMEIKYIILNDEIRKELLQKLQGAVSDIIKYDAYVELYWASKKSELDPDFVDVCKENVKKMLINQRFNIVDFSAIRDHILKLKLADRADLAGMDLDQLDEFEKDFAISQVSRYDTGLSILAEYAQLLVGVTIRNIEIVNNMVNIDLAMEAYLIEAGKRHEIAKVDEHSSAPYVPGSKQVLLVLAEETAQKGAKDLALQMRSYLLKKAKRQDVVATKTFRLWRLKFQGTTEEEFYNIKVELKKCKDWVFKNADTADRTVEVEYVGLVDDLADQVYSLISSKAFPLSVPEYTNEQNIITYRKKGGQ